MERTYYLKLFVKVQDHLLEYEVEIVAEILIEGLSRVKRCTDEGQAFLSLDLQVYLRILLFPFVS